MSRLQTSTKECFNTNVYLDSLMSFNKYNDAFLHSNFSNRCNIPHILKMYANELHSSYGAYKSDSSHIKSENFSQQRTENISENTYLNSVLHSSHAISLRNENKMPHSNENVCYYMPYGSKKNYSSKNRNCSYLNSVVAKNDSMESFYIEEKKDLGYNEELYSEHDNEGCCSMNCENNIKNYSEFSDIVKSINGELDDVCRNSSSYIKDPLYVTENSLNSSDKNHSKIEYDSYERNNAHVDENYCNNNCCMSDLYKENIKNNYPLNYSTETFETIYEGILNSDILNDFSLDEYRNNNICYSNNNIRINSEFDKYSELKNINTSLNKEIECNVKTEKNGTLPLKKDSSIEVINSSGQVEESKNERYSSEKRNKEKKNIPLFNKKPKSYSLEDMRSGKVQIPSTIFMKLPFNSTGDNIIDSYRKNNKLLSFMKECNDSVNIILKYPQVEKNTKRELKIPLKIASVISDNMGLPIIYEDEFDRRNYHPNVQNLHMGKIFENHVFSILKNKKDLGKKIFSKSSKFKKYNYDNNEGFWISNIDKKRLINPEKNDSYITELVYEKNNTYDEEMKIFKSCKNYEVIPPIHDLHKDNNFYLFLRKEKLYPNSLNPVITTIMRKYDVDKVSDYKSVESCKGITPVYK